jgi:hypothetical protein
LGIEELDISEELYVKLKRKGCDYVSRIADFPLKTLKKDQLIELLRIFLNKNEILQNYKQSHDDDQVLIAQMDKDIKGLKFFYDYFSELYGDGLEVANWHQNGDLEPFDNFFESAEEEMEGDQ